MSQREEEILEAYINPIHYNLHRSKNSNLDKYILKTILIRGTKDACLDMLNLMGKGHMSKDPYDDIVSLFLRSSRSSERNKTFAQDAYGRIQKLFDGGVTTIEIDNIFENFKTDIIRSLYSYLDML